MSKTTSNICRVGHVSTNPVISIIMSIITYDGKEDELPWEEEIIVNNKIPRLSYQFWEI